MNEYRYADIAVGHREQFSVTVTPEMLRQFCALTGDENPLHTDDAFAVSRGRPGVVAYGMLTASFLSTLAGVYLPGKNSLIHSVDVKFPKPVYPGNTLTIAGEVTEKNDTFRLLTLKATICNEHGEKVARAQMRVGVVEDA